MATHGHLILSDAMQMASHLDNLVPDVPISRNLMAQHLISRYLISYNLISQCVSQHLLASKHFFWVLYLGLITFRCAHTPLHAPARPCHPAARLLAVRMVAGSSHLALRCLLFSPRGGQTLLGNLGAHEHVVKVLSLPLTRVPSEEEARKRQ